jgi:YVTN family beta-propeller protein
MSIFRYLFLIVICSLSLEATQKVYVSIETGEIAIINPENNAFYKKLVPSFEDEIVALLGEVIISPDQSRAYVTEIGNSAGARLGIWVINTLDDTVVDFIAIPGAFLPLQLNILPDGSKIYVSDLASGNVYVIKLSDSSVTELPPGATKPTGLAFSPDGTKLFVSDSDFTGTVIYVYDTVSDTPLSPVLVSTGNAEAEFLAINSAGLGYAPIFGGIDVISFNALTSTYKHFQ